MESYSTRKRIEQKRRYTVSSDSEDENNNSDNDYNSEETCSTNKSSTQSSRKRIRFEDDSDEYLHETTGRKPKSCSKNALNARANRLKKKRYVENLEKEVTRLRDENGKLNSILDNQSYIIETLRKEVRYVKNVLANNSDLTKLLKAINGNTGMPVTTSLDKSLTIQNDFASLKKTEEPVANEHVRYTSTSSLDNLSTGSSLEVDEDLFSSGLLFPDYDICFNNNEALYGPDTNLTKSMPPLKEHSYTMNPHENTIVGEHNNENECGVCLHVSNGKLSLEFCTKCNDDAFTTWKDLDLNANME